MTTIINWQKGGNAVAMRYKKALFYHVNHVIAIYNLGDYFIIKFLRRSISISLRSRRWEVVGARKRERARTSASLCTDVHPSLRKKLGEETSVNRGR